MAYRFIIAVAVIPFLFLAVSCGSSKHSGKSALPGTWQATPIVIDGDSKDWPSPYPNYDAKALVAYATSNDRENLYITVETGDPQTQLKIIKQGMVISIDTSGHREPQFNINYPLQNEEDPLDVVNQGNRPSNNAHTIDKQMEKRVNKNMDAANQFSLDGFPDCNGGFMVNQNLPCGIKVKIKMDEYKELVWEAVVPFKAIYGRKEITAADAGKPISVCFAVNAFKHQSKGSTENSNGNMNQGMGGGGMKGAMRGGGGRTPASPTDHLYEHTKTWKQFGIAFQ